MTVYVDELMEYPLGMVPGAARVKYWCHMWADDVEELQSFARSINLPSGWFQNHNFKHYDLSQTWRARAIGAGAVERDFMDWLKEGRTK